MNCIPIGSLQSPFRPRPEHVVRHHFTMIDRPPDTSELRKIWGRPGHVEKISLPPQEIWHRYYKNSRIWKEIPSTSLACLLSICSIFFGGTNKNKERHVENQWNYQWIDVTCTTINLWVESGPKKTIEKHHEKNAQTLTTFKVQRVCLPRSSFFWGGMSRYPTILYDLGFCSIEQLGWKNN